MTPLLFFLLGALLFSLLVGMVRQAAFLLFVAPAVLCSRMTLDLRDPLREVTDEEISREAKLGFEAREDHARAAGWEPAGRFRASIVGDVDSLISLLVRPEGHAALVFMWSLPMGRKQREALWVTEFVSETADGGEYNTNDSAASSTPDTLACKRVWVLPGLDFDALERAHRTLTDAVEPPPAWQPVPLDEPGESMIATSMLRYQRKKVAAGLWRERDGVFRMSLRNAYPMTWAQLKPFKQLRAAWVVRRSRAALTAAEAGEPLPPVVV